MGKITKVLIVGSKGMAGHIIYHYLKENTNFQVIDIARGNHSHVPNYEIDVTDFETVTNVLKRERPDFIVNCIGILNKDAEDNPEKSILLNSYLPHFLARIAKDIGSKLIHISTDCVFDGKRGAYTETSRKDGVGFYAETKALGEVVYGNNLTIRTSIIGPELKTNGIGLFNWFMQQNGTIKGYTNAFWTGITTIELAKVIVSAIDANPIGLHHIVNSEKINKFELVNLFKKIFEKDSLIIEPYDNYKVDKSLIRTDKTFGYLVPSYEQMIVDMKMWIVDHQSLYRFY